MEDMNDNLMCTLVVVRACCLPCRGNVELALGIYEAMCRATPSVHTSIDAPFSSWPAATLRTVTALVLGLVKALRMSDACAAVEDLRRRGLPRGDEVPFGQVSAKIQLVSRLTCGCPICSLSQILSSESCHASPCVMPFEQVCITGSVVRTWLWQT